MKLVYMLFFIILGSTFSFEKVERLKAEKIIGGQVARINQFTFAVVVMFKQQKEKLVKQNPCSGSIIDDWFIITVAHCFYNRRTGTYKNKEYYIAFSIIDILYPLQTTQYIGVDLVIMPSSYDPLGQDTYSAIGNLAVVQLAKSLELHQSHPQLKKLKISQDVIRDSNGNYMVAGYGWNVVELITTDENYLINFMQSGRGGGRLRFADVAILGYEDCLTALQDDIAIGNMCANIIQAPNEHKGICQGDSGGPLFSGDYLCGIAISGFPECNENKKPGIYIRVPAYYQFINNVLRRNQTSDMRIIKLQKTSSNIFEFKEISTFA